VLLWSAVESVNKINALRERQPNFDVYANNDNNTRIPVGSDTWYGEHVGAKIAGWVRQPRTLGCHHQKILLVYGADGLVGFCGGVDIAADRMAYLHDVHVQVKGSAAIGLWKVVEKRWAHAKNDGSPPTPASISNLAPGQFLPPPYTAHMARVVQTVGNPDIKGTPDTLWPAVRRAIQQASRYIYVEDQYFWSLDLVKELAAAAKRGVRLTILLSPDHVAEFPAHRHRALKLLKDLSDSSSRENIGLFHHTRGDREWIHSKLFVLDDLYAIIGSANANNRGYFTDSEVAACVAEYSWSRPEGGRHGSWFVTVSNFARRLRVRLWSEHLELEEEEVFDAIGALAHWDTPPPQAHVGTYEVLNLKDVARQAAGHDRAFKAWEKGGYKGPPPAEPQARAPWWRAPYDEWAAPRSDFNPFRKTRPYQKYHDWLYGPEPWRWWAVDENWKRVKGAARRYSVNEAMEKYLEGLEDFATEYDGEFKGAMTSPDGNDVVDPIAPEKRKP
jgi:phosphatidylserine/phosphatidylglycerophosphate/cardiolipin synthase-like enzyme